VAGTWAVIRTGAFVGCGVVDRSSPEKERRFDLDGELFPHPHRNLHLECEFGFDFGSVLLVQHDVRSHVEEGIQEVLVVRSRVKAFTPSV